MNVDALIEGLPRFVDGLMLTVMYAGVSLAIGFFLAIPVAMMRMSRNRVIYWSATAYITFFRGTPLLAQLFLVYYGSGQFYQELEIAGLWWLFREPWFCGLLTLTLNTTAYTSEIWRGGIQAIPHPEIEAAHASGLSSFSAMRHVILPRALGLSLARLYERSDLPDPGDVLGVGNIDHGHNGSRTEYSLTGFRVLRSVPVGGRAVSGARVRLYMDRTQDRSQTPPSPSSKPSC
ncbi:MAG: ABC transporter permease subunit [Halofilum sp. (in: g-proteobacteria)]|nr:ABC transporter permease subunit [Halofilum sp. (in: g-proteobacteria)]